MANGVVGKHTATVIDFGHLLSEKFGSAHEVREPQGESGSSSCNSSSLESAKKGMTKAIAMGGPNSTRKQVSTFPTNLPVNDDNYDSDD